MPSLLELLGDLPRTLIGGGNPEITGISYDSRRVQPGHLFCALPGQHENGAAFIDEAVRLGAAAVLTSAPAKVSCPQAVVGDPLLATALVSAAFFGHPSERLTVVGVTGTNGKTTFCSLFESILREAGHPCGVIGTIDYRLGEKSRPATRTTPLASDLQALLKEFAEQGATHVAMEASSHALALKRTDGIRFAAAVFTNLTQDHLDFHGTLEAYFEAKSRLFDLLASGPEGRERTAIINADDRWGRKLLRRVKTKTVSYGTGLSSALRAASIRTSVSGTHFMLIEEGRTQAVSLKLLGVHNVYNALAAWGAARAIGVDTGTAIEGLQALEGVPGRFEKVSGPGDPAVVVDYAHTADALERVLETARSLKPRKLAVVFGCGGDRDRGKRPLMGEVAARFADHVILTSDNPRSEDPGKILLDIEVGLRRVKTTGYEILPDRAEAIRKAIESAGARDLILIAGKGHETTQIYADRTVPFDDRAVAREVLGRRT